MSRRPSPPDVVGIAEVAELAGVAKPTVSSWLERGAAGMPEPARLACGAVWRRDVIVAWLRHTERLRSDRDTPDANVV